jgi:hypothetical protein
MTGEPEELMKDKKNQNVAAGLPRFRSGEEFDALSTEDKDKVWKVPCRSFHLAIRFRF